MSRLWTCSCGFCESEAEVFFHKRHNNTYSLLFTKPSAPVFKRSDNEHCIDGQLEPQTNSAHASEGALHDRRGAAQGRLHRQDVLLRHEAGRGQDDGRGSGLAGVQERCKQEKVFPTIFLPTGCFNCKGTNLLTGWPISWQTWVGVDFDLDCSTLCLCLPGLMVNRRKWLSR